MNASLPLCLEELPVLLENNWLYVHKTEGLLCLKSSSYFIICDSGVPIAFDLEHKLGQQCALNVVPVLG